MKTKIFYFILGAIIFSGISVFATIKFQANEIGYNNTTVEETLNDLYEKVNSTADEVVINNSGTYTFTKDYSKVYVFIARSATPDLMKNNVAVQSIKTVSAQTVSLYLSSYYLENIKANDVLTFNGIAQILPYK